MAKAILLLLLVLLLLLLAASARALLRHARREASSQEGRVIDVPYRVLRPGESRLAVRARTPRSR